MPQFPVILTPYWKPWYIFQNQETNIGTSLLAKLQILFIFYQFFCFEYPFSFPESKSGSHILFNSHVSLISSGLWQFVRFFFFLIALTLLNSTGQIFCRMSLHLICLIFFSRLDLGYGVWEEQHKKWVVHFFTLYHRVQYQHDYHWWGYWFFFFNALETNSKHILPYDPAVTLWVFILEEKNLIQHTNLYTNVYSSFYS